MKAYTIAAMEDISSTCDDRVAKDSGPSGNYGEDKVRYDCESDIEYDSENETIDVICENSELVITRNNERSQNNRVANPCTNSNKLYFYDNKLIYPPKTMIDSRNVCSNTNYSQSAKETLSITNSRSKTFLIDSILGNNSSNSKVDNSALEDSDNFEETADEHNGKQHTT